MTDINNSNFNAANLRANAAAKINQSAANKEAQAAKKTTSNGASNTGDLTAKAENSRLAGMILAFNPGFNQNNFKSETQFRPETGHSEVDKQLAALNSKEGFAALETKANQGQDAFSGIFNLNGPEFEKAIEVKIANLPEANSKELAKAKEGTAKLLAFQPKPQARPSEADLIALFHSEAA